jgi:hypothetical protein
MAQSCHCNKHTSVSRHQGRTLNWGPVLQPSLIRAPGNLWSLRKGISLTAKCRDLPCPLPPSNSEAGTCLTQPCPPASLELGDRRAACPWGSRDY